jgi:hypothetical protein
VIYPAIGWPADEQGLIGFGEHQQGSRRRLCGVQQRRAAAQNYKGKRSHGGHIFFAPFRQQELSLISMPKFAVSPPI